MELVLRQLVLRLFLPVNLPELTVLMAQTISGQFRLVMIGTLATETLLLCFGPILQQLPICILLRQAPEILLSDGMSSIMLILDRDGVLELMQQNLTPL